MVFFRYFSNGEQAQRESELAYSDMTFWKPHRPVKLETLGVTD
jgi:hypothetical protein